MDSKKSNYELENKKVIEKNKDSKILCTFGMEHNYLIYKELKK